MREDYGHEFETIMDREATERLLEQLRQHHPEAETSNGWRSMDRPLPPMERPKAEPVKAMAPEYTSDAVITPHTATMGLLREVAAKHSVTVTDIKGGRRRYRKHVVARQEAMARLWHERGMSMNEIGQLLGGYDHSTVHHGLRCHAVRQRGAGHGPQ